MDLVKTRTSVITDRYEFQRFYAGRITGVVLNAACGDDAARLAELPIGAINMDIQDSEPWSGHGFDKPQNYVHGSVFKIPFNENHFEGVVLGEFLEHCKFKEALDAVLECRRVLNHGGELIITVPLDWRPIEEQRMGPDDNSPMSHGEITTYHQTWWSNKMLQDLLRESRMWETVRSPLYYMLTAPIGGWGLVWEKP